MNWYETFEKKKGLVQWGPEVNNCTQPAKLRCLKFNSLRNDTLQRTLQQVWVAKDRYWEKNPVLSHIKFGKRWCRWRMESRIYRQIVPRSNTRVKNCVDMEMCLVCRIFYYVLQWWSVLFFDVFNFNLKLFRCSLNSL